MKSIRCSGTSNETAATTTAAEGECRKVLPFYIERCPGVWVVREDFIVARLICPKKVTHINRNFRRGTGHNVICLLADVGKYRLIDWARPVVILLS